MTTEYTAIDCGLHSQFELAIMHKQWLLVSWKEPHYERKSIRAKPIDIYARNHEEFLVIVDEQDTQHTIRLDHIIHLH